MRRLNVFLLFMIALTLVITLLIEVSVRAKYVGVNLGKMVDDVHLEVIKTR